jgi:hypothetical protein
MGSVISMSSCAGACACLTCDKLTSCICKSLGVEGNSIKAKKKSKVIYLFLMALSVFFAVVLQYSISPHLNIKGIWDIGCGDDDEKAIYSTQINNCKGTAAVYRISFMSTVFFLLNAIGCFCSDNFHSNHWSMKIFIWIILMGSSIFIPNTVFSTGYDWFSRIVSFLFLITQVVVLIDFSYKWNNNWVNKSSELELENKNGQKYLLGLISISSIFYIISLVGISFMYNYFGHCGILSTFITVTFIGSFLFSCVQLCTDNSGSILSSSIVTLYCVWLCLSSITSYIDKEGIPDNKKCNIMNYTIDNVSSIIMGGVIAGLSLAWTSFNSFKSFSRPKEEPTLNQYVLETEDNEESETEHNKDSNRLSSESNKTVDLDSGSELDLESQKKLDNGEDNERYYIFHIIMMIGSIYMAMLLTDWGTKRDPTNTVNITGGKTGMWVKIISQWITMILYYWTLVARKCFPNRTFD